MFIYPKYSIQNLVIPLIIWFTSSWECNSIFIAIIFFWLDFLKLFYPKTVERVSVIFNNNVDNCCIRLRLCARFSARKMEFSSVFSQLPMTGLGGCTIAGNVDDWNVKIRFTSVEFLGYFQSALVRIRRLQLNFII